MEVLLVCRWRHLRYFILLYNVITFLSPLFSTFFTIENVYLFYGELLLCCVCNTTLKGRTSLDHDAIKTQLTPNKTEGPPKFYLEIILMINETFFYGGINKWDLRNLIEYTIFTTLFNKKIFLQNWFLPIWKKNPFLKYKLRL